MHVPDDGFTAILNMQHYFQSMHDKKMCIMFLTDSFSLLDFLSKRSTTTEQRQMIDLKSTREAYDTEVINYLC